MLNADKFLASKVCILSLTFKGEITQLNRNYESGYTSEMYFLKLFFYVYIKVTFFIFFIYSISADYSEVPVGSVFRKL